MPTFQPVASLKGKNVTTANQFSREEIDALCDLALEMKVHVEQKKLPIEDLKGRIMTPLFFEDSSRTRSSFCAAMMRLGGSVVNFDVANSSINKGETLSDTVRTLNSYSDVLVLRHPKNEALEEAVSALNAHNSGDVNAYSDNENHTNAVLMNAGNGSGEHPSQALLDALTMRAELGAIDGLTIALIGDLKMGRTVHSLLRLLTRNFSPKKVYFVAPESLQMPPDVIAEVDADVKKRGVELVHCTGLTPQVVRDADVLYCTRLQKERFVSSAADDAAAVKAFEHAKDSIRVDAARLRDAKEKMIVMHPLPRVDELSSDIDADPRAALFRQMRYGLFMRMALLFSVLV